MELKTLKDIEHRIWTNEDTNVFTNNKIRKRLKQEAIKWVNYYGIDDGEIGACFLKFFDIDEEDLK